jgi:HEPN domain-containing protein
MHPQTTEDWLFVAKERGADAEAIIKTRPDSVGSVYLAGYAVECSLKAYLRAAGIPFPTAGRGGHDLTALWRASGFSKRDIADINGSKVFYLEGWSTGLRYYTTHVYGGLRNEELLIGAKRVVGWLQQQARRTDLSRRRRK